MGIALRAKRHFLPLRSLRPLRFNLFVAGTDTGTLPGNAVGPHRRRALILVGPRRACHGFHADILLTGKSNFGEIRRRVWYAIR